MANWHREQKRLARIAEKVARNAPPPKPCKPRNYHERLMARRRVQN